MATLNVGDVIKESDVTISPAEREEERTIRLEAEKRAKLLDDIKSMVIFFFALIIAATLGVLCANLVFFDKTATPEAQKWAQTALTALVSGGVSFLLGKAVAK